MLDTPHKRRQTAELPVFAPEAFSEALGWVYRRNSLNYCGLLFDVVAGQRKIPGTQRDIELDSQAEAACDKLVALNKHPGLQTGKSRLTPFNLDVTKDDFAKDVDVAAFYRASSNAHYCSTNYFPFRDLSGALCVSRVVSRYRILDAEELQLIHCRCFEALEQLHLAAPIDDSPARLTARERECLIAAAKGLTEKQTGQLLSISHFTVRAHIDSCRRKFAARNKLTAVISALKLGEITPAEIEAT